MCRSPFIISAIILGSLTGVAQHPVINLDTIPQLKALIDTMAQGIYASSMPVFCLDCPPGTLPAQWKRFERMDSIATTNQLIALTYHENGVVRCYAIEALDKSRSFNAFPILLDHLNDKTNVQRIDADMGGTQNVGSFFYDHCYRRLTYSQKAVVDSIMLFDDSIKNESKQFMMQHLKRTPANYVKLKELVERDQNGYALIALARYHKPEDTALIFSFLNNPNNMPMGLWAVSKFPDIAFYNRLMQIAEDQFHPKYVNYFVSGMLYEALARYPRLEVLDYFEKVIKDEKEGKDKRSMFSRGIEKSVQIIGAITKNPDPLFEPLNNEVELDQVGKMEIEMAKRARENQDE